MPIIFITPLIPSYLLTTVLFLSYLHRTYGTCGGTRKTTENCDGKCRITSVQPVIVNSGNAATGIYYYHCDGKYRNAMGQRLQR